MTDHSDTLQVHLRSPEFFPAVMLVAFALWDPAVLSSRLKNIAH